MSIVLSVDLEEGLSLQVRSTGVKGWVFGLLDLSLFLSVDQTQKGPRVVLVNKFGKEHIIKQYMSTGQAIRDVERIAGEIDEDGYPTWADTSGVPPNFDIMQRDS